MKNYPCFNLNGTSEDWRDLDQNFNKGDSIFHTSSGGLSGISSGDWIHLVKYRFDYEDPHEAIAPDIVGQITRLEAKGMDATGEWGEIKDVANMNYIDSSDPDYSLKVRKVIPVQNIGIEGLTINRDPHEQATAYIHDIQFGFAVNCWVKGVESYKASRNHLAISYSSHIEISGCYFHEAMDYGDGGWGYGVVTGGSSTNCLIENNIFRKLRHAMVAGGGSNCNVWTFNYSREKENSTRDLDLHAKYPFGHLFEHNYVAFIEANDYHGLNGPYNAFVRNTAYSDSENEWGAIVLKNAPNSSVLGCEVQSQTGGVGGSGTTSFVIEKYGKYVPSGLYEDGIWKTHYEVYLNVGFRIYSFLADYSYYYSSRPAFLDMNYSFPTLGPNYFLLTQSIPARERFNSSVKTYLADPTPKPLTTSGTLPNDEIWPNGHTLTGNVTVPDNIILFISNGATINLNGYYVKCQGSGQIIKQGSATFSPYDISIKSGAVIKGQYPSINSAFANVVSGQAIVVGGGSHTVSNNLTVASGVTLQINAGTTLNFNGNYKLRVEGTLTANGIYSNKITFTRSGGTWYGIEFYNASYLSQISYSIIQSAQYGVRIINSSPNLTWNTIKLNTVGVQFENNSYDYATTLQGNMIEENVDGVKCYQYSDPAINPSNVIRYNNFYGVYGDATAVPSLGFYYPTGYNSVYYNTFEVWSTYPGTIYARYHWWGDSNPTPNVSGNVDWSNYLDYDPNSGMGKAQAKEVSSENRSNDIASGAAADTVGMVEVDHAYKVFLEGNGEQALALFESLVGKYPDHLAGRRALAFVSRCLYKLNRRNEAVARMNQLVQNHAGKEVFGLAQSFATGELVKNGQYAEAIATSQTILSDFPKTTLAKYALYDLGSIYWYRLEDQKTGEVYYRQLIAEWPDDDLAISALATLGEWNPKPDKGSAPALTNTQNVPAQYALSQNFPNPFNPQTMIQYQLPEASRVTLTIYNLFGQEVRTLVAGQREAGYHAEIWDGRDDFGRKVASGVYFYRLSAAPNVTQPNGFQFTRKMVLTQ
ncbi:MAG: hypothetical protein ALAOOOJD_04841 [bacterium]|nr:hypothetical protein [bacterium]